MRQGGEKGAAGKNRISKSVKANEIHAAAFVMQI